MTDPINFTVERRIEKARDLILDFVNEHELSDHDGAVCIGTRIGIVGFLGHCLGLTEDHFDGVKTSITWHNEQCQHSEVSHHHDHGSENDPAKA